MDQLEMLNQIIASMAKGHRLDAMTIEGLQKELAEVKAQLEALAPKAEPFPPKA